MTSQPYRSTPIFDEESLPKALRENHTTKAGTWGRIRVLEGRLKLTYVDPPSEVILEGNRHGVVQPEQVHFVTPLGPMKMQVDFFHHAPE